MVQNHGHLGACGGQGGPTNSATGTPRGFGHMPSAPKDT